MKFPIEQCFVVKSLSKDDYFRVIDKMVLDGYTIPSRLRSEVMEDYERFTFCGVNSNGDILMFDSQYCYIDIDKSLFQNVLTSSWLLETYLGQ